MLASKSYTGNWNTFSRPYFGEKVFIKSIKSVEYTFIEKLISEIKAKLRGKFFTMQVLKNSRLV